MVVDDHDQATNVANRSYRHPGNASIVNSAYVGNFMRTGGPGTRHRNEIGTTKRVVWLSGPIVLKNPRIRAWLT